MKSGNFAECFSIGTRQSVPISPSVFTLAHGKQWDFAVCQMEGTRQRMGLCRVLYRLALGKAAVNGRHGTFFAE